MQKLDVIHIIAAGVGILLTGGLAFLGLAQTLGAHPFWGVSGSLYGAAIGALLYLAISLLNLRLRFVAMGALLAAIATFVATYFGKQQFAASFAEDALAGRFWYFGWIGFVAASCFVLALLVQMLLTWQKHRTA